MRRALYLVVAITGGWLAATAISCAYQSAVGSGISSSPAGDSPVLRRRIAVRPVAHLRAEYTGEGCVDTVEFHWGMREPDSIYRIFGDCTRVLLVDHEFNVGAPRYVEVVFKRAGVEVGRDSIFVRPWP